MAKRVAEQEQAGLLKAQRMDGSMNGYGEVSYVSIVTRVSAGQPTAACGNDLLPE